MNTPTPPRSGQALPRDFTPQRRNPRIPFEVEVTVESEHNFYTGFTSNISEGGLFVATSHLRPVGTKVHFTFTLNPSPEKISVYGVVRWVRESSRLTEDAPSGMGIQFEGLTPAINDRINQFIRRQRDTIFYDD